MLSDLQSPDFSALAVCSLLSLVVWYVIQRTRHELRIRKIGGVRAPSVGTNPLSGTWRIAGIARARMRMNMLDYFNGLFDHATPGCPNCVELQVSPRERFIITRDPEHIKAVFATQFNEYGKGPSFHRLSNFRGERLAPIRPESGVSALLTKLPPSGQTVDMMDLFFRMTLDITTDFLLSASANSLANPQSEFANAFDEVQRLQTLMTYIEQALALAPEEPHKSSSASDKAFTFLHSIAQHTRSPPRACCGARSSRCCSRAATLAWAMYELCRYPPKYARRRGGAPTYADLKAMSYLRHTLSETLRLYPAVPYNNADGAPRHDAAGGDTRRADLYPGGRAGTRGLFAPERWECGGPRGRGSTLPFNGGPRICVGQNFALSEMAYCLVRIVQKYERVEYRGDWHAPKHWGGRDRRHAEPGRSRGAV
ncbi:cytochrome P450 [Ustulina deusta]|nr:cytochrome P450 [Ustulina deusta]